MKTILLALAFITGTCFTALAQSLPQVQPGDGGKFSIGVEGGLPIGHTTDRSSVVIGGSIKYEIPVAQNTLFTVSAGYTNFLYKQRYKDLLKLAGKSESGEGFIPVKVGIKYYIENGFFAEAQAGVAFSTQSGGTTKYVFSPGAGYTFSNGLEVGARFEGWAHKGRIYQAAARVAYRF